MTTNLRLLVLPALCVTAGFLSSARVHAAGELLFPECSPGSVVDVSSGGDLTAAPRFATGLGQVNDVCQGPEGRIYVAGCTQQAVYDITDGGDFTGATAYATGLGCVVGLYCDANRILVADYNGRIIDVTEGGTFTGDTTTTTPVGTVDVVADSEGRVWASITGRGIIDVTATGDFSTALGDATWSDGASYGSFGAFNGDLFVSSSGDGGIYNFDGAGDLTGQQFAYGIGIRPGAVVEAPEGAFVLSETGVWEVTAGGDLSASTPFATGIDHSCTVAGGVYVNGCGDGLVLEGIEACDDGNDDDTDACSNACTINSVDPSGTGSSGEDSSGSGMESDSSEGGTSGSESGVGTGSGEASTASSDATDGSASDSTGDPTGTEGASTSETGAEDATGSSESRGSDESTGMPATTAGTGGTTSSATGTTGTSGATTGPISSGSESTTVYTGPLDDDGGCSCDTSGPGSSGGAWLMLALGGWLRRRRKAPARL